MPTFLDIIRIDADPADTIPVNYPGGHRKFLIWPSLLPGGEPTPTILRISEPGQIVKLMVTFRFTYAVQPWIQPGSRYTLNGRGPNGTTIQSEIAGLPASGATAVAHEFSIMVPQTTIVAFCEGKPWRWTITYYPPVGTPLPSEPPSVSSRTRTRLEFYFYAASMESHFFTSANGIDVRLLRLVVPPRDIIYTPYTNWSALYRWIVERTWNYGSDVNPRLQYDTFDGEAYFDVLIDSRQATLTEYFDLDAWLGKTWDLCNCLDLAVFIHLACRALGYNADDAKSVVESRMVTAEPWGYIRPGILFGLPAFPGCNNPFFRADKDEATLDQFHEDRQGFAAHFWVEAPLDDDEVAMDACHCVGGKVSTGLALGNRDNALHHDRSTEPGPPDDLLGQQARLRDAPMNIITLVAPAT